MIRKNIILVIFLSSFLFSEGKMPAFAGSGDACRTAGGHCVLQLMGTACGGNEDNKGAMDCPESEGCCAPRAGTEPTPTPTPTPPGSGGAFDYTPMEKIPGFESVGSDFPKYVVAIYKFGIWTIGIAGLLMITLGGFMYITSAGNTASMGKAKGYITDAIIGIIMALTAYLLLYTINPDLLTIKSISNSGGGGTGGGGGAGGGGAAGQCCVKANDPGTGDYGNYEKNCAEASGGTCSEGYQLQTGACGSLKACGGGSGSGSCKPLTGGPCSPSNLQGKCNWNAEEASGICNAESGGVENKASGVDVCTDGKSFSWGLFQINLTCQCKTAFAPQKARGCINKAGHVVDESSYNSCVANYTQAGPNIGKACELYKYGGWSQWGANSNCKYNPKKP